MEIQESVPEGGSLAPVKRWLGAVILQFVFAEVVSFLCGGLPEAKFQQRFADNNLGAFAPFITCAGLILGFYLSPIIMKGKGAAWTWLIGILLLAYGISKLAIHWSPQETSEPTRWAYAVANVFGNPDQCDRTGCVNEMIFTTPCSVAVAYSIGAIVFRGWEMVRKQRGQRTPER